MTESTDPSEARHHAASADLALTFQLLEIECAIYHGGAADQTAHDFIDGFTQAQREGVHRALRRLLIQAAVHNPDAAGLVVAGSFKPLRETSVAVAMLMGFDRKQAMTAATMAAERM